MVAFRTSWLLPVQEVSRGEGEERDMWVALMWEREGRRLASALSLVPQKHRTAFRVAAFQAPLVGGSDSTSSGSGRWYCEHIWRT